MSVIPLQLPKKEIRMKGYCLTNYYFIKKKPLINIFYLAEHLKRQQQ